MCKSKKLSFSLKKQREAEMMRAGYDAMGQDAEEMDMWLDIANNTRVCC